MAFGNIDEARWCNLIVGSLRHCRGSRMQLNSGHFFAGGWTQELVSNVTLEENSLWDVRFSLYTWALYRIKGCQSDL